MRSRKAAVRRVRTGLALAAAGWLAAGCATAQHGRIARGGAPKRHAARGHAAPAADEAFLRAAERKAASAGRAVLATGRDMTVRRREVIPGGCWDYADAVYRRAGWDANRRETVYKTGKRGPYAGAKLLRPGDMLSYVNHSYGGIEHTAIFVDWLDEAARTALMLSYGGERRREPARYLPYDLSSVFAVVRPRAG